MLDIVELLLGFLAIYSGGMWLWLAGLSVICRSRFDTATLIEFERQTFHLGLCFILSLGFFGLIAGHS